MTYSLIFTDSYNKKAAKFLKKHPDLINQYEKTLKVLELNPHHPSLRLHALKGKLQGMHSASINISYRITLELIIDENEIIPVAVGHHVQVYCVLSVSVRKSIFYCAGAPRNVFARLERPGKHDCHLEEFFGGSQEVYFSVASAV